MARKKKLSIWQKFSSEIRNFIRPAFFILLLVIAALIVVNADQKSNTEDKPKPETGRLTETKLENPSKSQTQSHTVQPGDSLSKIAYKYYGDKNKWAVLAAENNISDPNLITAGTILTIPDLTNQTSSITTTSEQKAEVSDTTVNQPKTYTVVSGDTLWEISIQYYGTGYEWFRIRDANPDKVELLPNDRPLISPGTVLMIPKL